MKTLVIHPKDQTTDFLTEIYSNKDWTLINSNVSKKILKDSIKLHDRVVMLGHGTKQGLLGFNRYVIDSTWVYLLREKFCVSIWCNADKFVEKYKLRGFYTGMIISEYEEAQMYNIPTNHYFINESNCDFAKAIKHSIDTDDILNIAKQLYDGNSSVVTFNIKNNMKTPKTIKGYIKLLRSIEKMEISDMKGYELLPKNIKGNLIEVSAQISNVINEIK